MQVQDDVHHAARRRAVALGHEERGALDARQVDAMARRIGFGCRAGEGEGHSEPEDRHRGVPLVQGFTGLL